MQLRSVHGRTDLRLFFEPSGLPNYVAPSGHKKTPLSGVCSVIVSSVEDVGGAEVEAGLR